MLLQLHAKKLHKSIFLRKLTKPNFGPILGPLTPEQDFFQKSQSMMTT